MLGHDLRSCSKERCMMGPNRDVQRYGLELAAPPARPLSSIAANFGKWNKGGASAVMAGGRSGMYGENIRKEDSHGVGGDKEERRESSGDSKVSGNATGWLTKITGSQLPQYRDEGPVTGGQGGRGTIFEAQHERSKSLTATTYNRGWAAQSTLALKKQLAEQQVQGKRRNEEGSTEIEKTGCPIVAIVVIERMESRRIEASSEVGPLHYPRDKERDTQQKAKP